MPKAITKIAKRFMTGTVLLGAVVLAPKNGCDRLDAIGGPRTLTGFEDPEMVLGYGGPDTILGYGGPDATPLMVTD